MIPTEITDSTIRSQRTQAAPRFTMESSFWTIISFGFLSLAGAVGAGSLESLRDPVLAVPSVPHDAVEREGTRGPRDDLERAGRQVRRPRGVLVGDARLRAGGLVPGDARVLHLAPVDPVHAAVVIRLDVPVGDLTADGRGPGREHRRRRAPAVG